MPDGAPQPMKTPIFRGESMLARFETSVLPPLFTAAQLPQSPQ